MLERIKRSIAHPPFEDPAQNRMADMLNAMIIILFFSNLIFSVLLALSSPRPALTLIIYGTLNLLFLVSYYFMQHGKVRFASYLFILSIWGALTFVATFLYGGFNSPLIAVYIVLIAAAGILLGNRGGVLFACLSSLTIGFLYIADLNNWLIFNSLYYLSPGRSLLFQTLSIVLTVALIFIINQNISQEIQRASQHQIELFERNQELQLTRESLEQKVKERTSEILQQSQFFEALVQNNPIAVVTLDLDNKIISCNPAFEKLFGYRQYEILAKDLDGLITDSDSYSQAIQYTKQVASGQTIHRSGKRFQKNGDSIDVEIFGVPVIVAEEQIGILGLYQDITERKRAEDALRASEEKYRDLVENIDDIVYALDKNGIITYVSPAVQTILGYTPHEITGHHFSELIETTDELLINENYMRILSGYISSGEYRIRCKTGDMRWMHTSSQPIIDRDQVVGVQGILSDITDRKMSERALKDSEEKFRTLAEQSPNMVFINLKGRVVYANQRCEEIMGYTRDEFYAPDFNFLSLIAPEHRQKVMDNFKKHQMEKEIEPHEYSLITKFGERIEVIITTRLMNYNGEIAILGTITDITERKRAEERLIYIASHDSLTGLPNRTLFYDRLDHAIQKARRSGNILAVAFLDLDGFKMVNDTYGHEKGDSLLQDVARRLNQCVRESDSIARLGGDEFTFIFENIHNPTDAATIAEKIIQTLTQPFEVVGQEVLVTASIGLSLYPQDGESSMELLKKADAAMYIAKDLTKNSYQLYSD